MIKKRGKIDQPVRIGTWYEMYMNDFYDFFVLKVHLCYRGAYLAFAEQL